MPMKLPHGRLALVCLLVAAVTMPSNAHVSWTRANDVDPNCLGLYHISDANTSAGSIVAVPAAMPPGRGLLIQNSTQPMVSSTDTEAAIFNPYSLHLNGTAVAKSTDTLTTLTGDLTVESWFKWDALLTSSSVQFGLQSGAKLRITRDTANPANDQFGIQGTHGDFESAPGFTNWPAVGTEEAPLGDWLHAAITIHSTGIYANPTLAHDCYSTGTVAWFFLNGHYVGNSPFTIDLTNLRVHDASQLVIENLAGDTYLDEMTVWKQDWSTNGTNVNPFANGRGSGTFTSAVSEWMLYGSP